MTDSPAHLKSQFFPQPSSLWPAVSKDEGREKLLRIPTQTDESISGPEWAREKEGEEKKQKKILKYVTTWLNLEDIVPSEIN